MSTGNEFLTSRIRNKNESVMQFLTPPVHDFTGGFHSYPSSISHPFHNIEGTYEYQDVSEGISTKHAEKKTRLTNNQVKYLERSFDIDSKLDIERKNQLAQDLGLQSRQVAIWFQNRRARCKTKQLERDYDSLKVLYDAASREKRTLEAQVLKLKEMIKMRCEECKKDENEPSQVTGLMDVQEAVANRNEGCVGDRKMVANPIHTRTQEKRQEAEFFGRTERSELLNAESANEGGGIAYALMKETTNETSELLIRNSDLRLKMPEGHNDGDDDDDHHHHHHHHLPEMPSAIGDGLPGQYEEHAAIANLDWSYGLWHSESSPLFV